MSEQVANHALAIGRGSGVSGLKSLPYGNLGEYLQSQGPNADPIFTSLPSGVNGLLLANTRAVMAACDTSIYNAVYVYEEDYKIGMFCKKSYVDYSFDVDADTLQGYIVRSTFDPNIVWIRQEYFTSNFQLNWWRNVGAGYAQEKISIEAAGSSIPSGSTLVFPMNDTISSDPIVITTRGHISIKGNQSLIYCPNQTPTTSGTNVPIFRVWVRTFDYDVQIENLNIKGPRVSSDTIVGTGVYGNNPMSPGPGYPSGIDIPIGRNVTIYNCWIYGTYYSGIEVHYTDHILINNCKADNHGYAGILFSDSSNSEIYDNEIDDIGSTIIVNGYGISVATSYDYPTYTYGNISARIYSNFITKCKRKSIDVHNCMHSQIWGNYIKGFGYCAIEGTCEGSDKEIQSLNIFDNHIEGDISFVTSAAFSIISAGLYGSSSNPASQSTDMLVHNNHILNTSAPYGILFGNNDDSTNVAYNVFCQGNIISKSAFSGSGIFTGGYSTKIEKVIIANNTISADVYYAHVRITQAVTALSNGNICTGTSGTSAVTIFENVTNSSATNNYFNGTLGA